MQTTIRSLQARVRKLGGLARPCPVFVVRGPDKQILFIAHPEAPRGLRGEAAEEWIQAWEARCARP